MLTRKVLQRGIDVPWKERTRREAKDVMSKSRNFLAFAAPKPSGLRIM